MTGARALLDEATERLRAAGVESARHDAEELLAWVLGVARGRVALADLTEPEREAYAAALAERERRVPLQHITGSAGFRHLDLEVGPGVFVPRPETEVMTGVAVDELRRCADSGVRRPLAVDLCTGSGAVALSLAVEVPGARVVGVELEPAAHAFAARNAARLAPDVELRLGDMADAVEDLAGAVHVVTANPPYIPLDAYESVVDEARVHDPPAALWSGDDGLDAVRVVAAVAGRLLVDGGLVVCEHADAQGTLAPAVFAAHGGFTQVRDHTDLLGRPRFVSARRVRGLGTAPGTMSS